jgi:hypothetical protein
MHSSVKSCSTISITRASSGNRAWPMPRKCTVMPILANIFDARAFAKLTSRMAMYSLEI